MKKSKMPRKNKESQKKYKKTKKTEESNTVIIKGKEDITNL